MREEHHWGWPIACYLFLGGVGGGMIVVSALADLVFGKGDVFAAGSLVAGIAIGVGSGLLIFELGRPFQFWRVLSTQKAIMTVGAWMLSFTILTSLAYFSFWPEFSPWRGLVDLRHVFAGVNLFLGLGVCIYTGVLLGSLRARSFWNTPILPILFLVSGLSTGVAGQLLLAGVCPYWGHHNDAATMLDATRYLDVVLLAFELMILFVYVPMMRFSAGAPGTRVAAQWLTGSKKWLFWGGVIGLGLVLPGMLHLVHSGAASHLASPLVILGGLILRFLVVYSDERVQLPGESEYYSRLPGPDAPFLKA
jgi:protein NrfD